MLPSLRAFSRRLTASARPQLNIWNVAGAVIRSRPWIWWCSLFLGAAALYSIGLLRVQSILWGDTRYYYSYTKSLWVDGDLDFANEASLPEVGFPHPPAVSPLTGRVTNKFSPGAPLLWSPGFLLGQGLTHLAVLAGWPLRTDGYGWLTQYLTAVWAIGLAVAGVAVVYDALRRLSSTRAAGWSVALLFVGSPLLYYTAADPLNSHTASFLFSSLLLWLSYRWWRGQRGWRDAVILGAVGGGLTLIRNQDALLLIPVGIMLLLTPGSWPQRLGQAAVFTAAWLAVFSLQVWLTYYLYGQFGSPYLIQGERLSWLAPDFWQVFFTPHNGIFFFAPGLLAGVAGLGLASWRGQRFAQLCLVAFGLAAYGVAAWVPEILGGPYGSRMFVSSLPWLAVGVAWMVQQAQSRGVRGWQLSLFLLGLLLNNLVQTLIMLIRF